MPPAILGNLYEAESSEQLSGDFCALLYGSPLESLRRVHAPLGVTYSSQAASRLESGVSASRAVRFLQDTGCAASLESYRGLSFPARPVAALCFSRLFVLCFIVLIA